MRIKKKEDINCLIIRIGVMNSRHDAEYEHAVKYYRRL